MFLKKLFSKSAEQLRKNGDVLFHEGRYAEARQVYLDALEKQPGSENGHQDVLYMSKMISECGNHLAGMNIDEAESALRAGNIQKAFEHVRLSLEQANDVSVREKAEKLLESITESQVEQPAEKVPSGKHDCSSCDSSHSSFIAADPVLPVNLAGHEQFQLLINTLPGDLPQRYAGLGEPFASAYLLAHTENLDEARNKFRQLLSEGENDIMLYETALLEFRMGNIGDCEALLSRALVLNQNNPACLLSLAQLYANAGRFDEAIVLLKQMVENNIQYDHAFLLLADIYSVQGSSDCAVDLLSQGLQMPTLKKASAERLVRMLTSLGRDEEAAFLAKNYLKGCC